MLIGYRSDIDGLRAVAVLAVLAYHGFPELFPGGFIGVDIFFVISGYLITSILVREMEGGVWSIPGFYARRILRIFPALLLVLLTSFLVGWYTLLADEYKQLGKHIAAGAGFVANFAFWFEAGYFDRASELKPLLHLWSLGIEEQFYILWPILLWGIWRLGSSLKSWAIALILISLGASIVIVFLDRTQAFYSPLSRAWELLAGGVLALFLRNEHGVPRLLRLKWMQAAAMGIILLAVFFLRPSHPFPGILALVPVLAAVILIATDPAMGGITTVLRSKIMVAIGLISYPLYLWHWPLLSFARIVEDGEPSASVRLGLLLTSVALASLTYMLLEKSVRRLPRRWVIAGLVCGVALVGALGANVYKRDGMERIRHKRIIQVDEAASRDFVDFEKIGLITDFKCDRPFKFPEREVCLVMDPIRPVTAVVVGDSHAVHAFWGLSETMSRMGDNLKALGKGACVPFLAYSQAGNAAYCQSHIDETLRDVADDAAIGRVALVFRGRYLGSNATQSEIQAIQRSLDATLLLLTRAKKSVYYFLPLVEPGFDPRLCLGSLPLGRKPPHSCVIDQAADALKSKVLRDAVDQVLARYPAVRVIDPNVALCRDGKCPIIQEGRSIFKDDNHISEFGSRLIGDKLQLN